MQCMINGKDFIYNDNIRDNIELRKSFNHLCRKVFDLSFEDWWEEGYWTEKYIPHVLIKDNKVVANVSVNLVTFLFEGKRKNYVQLGTIMTDPKYRGQGLCRWLMEKVLDKYKDNCDDIYLFANNSVLDFYPRFGFKKADEYQYLLPVTQKKGKARKIDISNPFDRDLLIETYYKSNPYSAFSMEKNVGLLMFYCLQFLKNDIYYIDDYKAIIIAQQERDKLICYDIFCDKERCEIVNLLSIIAEKHTKTAVLGFTPKNFRDLNPLKVKEEDTTLFVFEKGENLCDNNKIMFPLLSHA